MMLAERGGLLFTFCLGLILAYVFTHYTFVARNSSGSAIITHTEYVTTFPDVIPVSDLPGVDAVELVRLFRELFEGKEAQKPHFLVVFGPPGSGKTRIVQKVFRNQHARRKNYAEIMVDRMLTRITSYRTQMDGLLHNRSLFDDDEFLRRSQAIYGRFRPLVKYFSNMLLDIALRQHLNVLFETTGSNISLTIQTVMAAKKLGYDIQVVFPYVTTNVLLERVDKRNQKIGRAIPRFMVQAMARDAQKNFLELLQFADRADLYDNNIPMDAELIELFCKREYDPKRSEDEDDDDGRPENTSSTPDKYRRLGAQTYTYRCSPQLSDYPELEDLKLYCQP